jgi:hypothetical protein
MRPVHDAGYANKALKTASRFRFAVTASRFNAIIRMQNSFSLSLDA